MFPAAEEARFYMKSFEKTPKAWLREDAEDIGSGGLVMAVVDKTDYASCTGIGHGKTYAMSESALGSWRSRSGLNGRPKSEGRQHLFHDEMPRVALWAQGYVLAGQPLEQFLPGFPFLWGIGVAGIARFDTQQFSASGDEIVDDPVGQKPIVSDSHQAFGDNVEEKTPHELPGLQLHDFVLVSLGAVLPSEGDPAVFHGHQPFVGQGDAVSVAPEVLEDLLRPGEGRFAVDHPILASSPTESILGIVTVGCRPAAVQGFFELP